MARKQSPLSKTLESLMNTQCIAINTYEKQQLRQVIDELDDKRRLEFRKGMKNRFIDIFEALESEDIYKAKKTLIKLESYFNREIEKEDHYEKLDDENRENIETYLLGSIEEIRNYNYEVENELMKK